MIMIIIIAFVSALVVGVLAGRCSDELLRGRDPRSRRVVVAGIIGAAIGLAIRSSTRDDTWVLEVLAALLGAVIAASAIRIRISSALASDASV